MVLSPERADGLLSAYEREGISCADIGEVIPVERRMVLVEAGHERELPRFARDEIARLFEETPGEA